MTPDRYQQLQQSVLDWLWLPVPYSEAPRVAVLSLVLGLALIASLTWWAGIPWVRRWWQDDRQRPGEDEFGVSIKEYTLLEHLLELRNRLVISAIALAAATAVCFVFYERWMEIALWPVQGHRLQAITPTELIFTYFEVALVVGLIVAMPVIAYQVWSFVAPGLTRKERKYALAIVPGATLSFAAGVAFAYFALMPAALGFLLGFGTNAAVDVVPTIESYISFLTHLLIAAGAIFELPLAIFFLAKLHLVNAKMLSGTRRYVIVGAFVVAAIVTPTPDPFNQALVAIPIMVLFEVGVLLSRFA